MDLDQLAKSLKNPPIQGYADLKQDILALELTNFKRGGYFVEFGVMDGRTYSNTYLLESQFDWRGIVVEPSKIFQDRLSNNRRCIIDNRAVADQSNRVLSFKETDVQLGLSGLVDYFDPEECHDRTRSLSPGRTYDVITVSLNDLLAEHNAPKEIDYISIDTEGSEPAILSTFDFGQYQVRLWTIEHNFSPARTAILKIMAENGYQRLAPELSTIDDWYIPI